MENIDNRLNKLDWIHSEYVKLFNPVFARRDEISDAERMRLKNQMDAIRREADKKFGI